MCVKIIADLEQNCKVLYCSSTMTPIGIVMKYDDEVEDFIEWLDKDARAYSTEELATEYYKWLDELEKEDERREHEYLTAFESIP